MGWGGCAHARDGLKVAEAATMLVLSRFGSDQCPHRSLLGKALYSVLSSIKEEKGLINVIK